MTTKSATRTTRTSRIRLRIFMTFSGRPHDYRGAEFWQYRSEERTANFRALHGLCPVNSSSARQRQTDGAANRNDAADQRSRSGLVSFKQVGEGDERNRRRRDNRSEEAGGGV